MVTLFFLVLVNTALDDRIYQYPSEESVCAAYKRRVDAKGLPITAYRLDVDYGFLTLTKLDCGGRP